MRVVSLHALDGILILGVLHLLAAVWPPYQAALQFGAAVVIVFLLSLNALSAYRPGDARRDLRRLLSGSLVGGLILTGLTLFPPGIPFEPVFLAVLTAAVFAALSAGRKVVDHAVRQVYKRGFGLRRAVLIGDLDEVGEAIGKLRDDRNIDQYVIGHLSADREPDPTALGGISDLGELLDRRDVEEVIVAATLPGRMLDRISASCFRRGVSLYAFSVATGAVYSRSELVRLGGCPLLRLHPARLEFPAMFLKRAVDVTLSCAALIALAPLFVAVAIAIKLDSEGPVFFRQRRVGVGGRHFTIWKFRSMFTDARIGEMDLAHLNTYGDSRLFKARQDPRVTRVGRWIRRTSIDELPQLFNVLRGDMSLVGPRPPLPREVASYEPHHHDRLQVVPGITGPWQAGGRNLIMDFEHVVRMERDYIRRWSLLLDLRILLRTVRVVVRGEGAY